MSNTPKGMKIIMPGLCPHCSKEIMITNFMTTPQLLSVHKPEDFEKAKEKVLGIIEQTEFASQEQKQMAIDYVKESLFGPAEIDDMLNQVLHQEDKEEPKDE